MKQADRNRDIDIDDRARRLFGYDDESLEAELDAAERIWEQEKAQDPAAAARAARAAKAGYERLMERLHAEGAAVGTVADEAVEPGTGASGVVEDEKEAGTAGVAPSGGKAEPPVMWSGARKPGDADEDTHDGATSRPQTPGKRWKGGKKRKILLLAAVLCVLGIGGTIVAVGRREYVYGVYPMPGERNVRVRANVPLESKPGGLIDTYNQISKKLGIRVLKLWEIPQKLKFEQAIIGDKIAIIELEYDEQKIYLKEAVAPPDHGGTQVIVSDRAEKGIVYNEWLDREIIIEENALPSGEVEYSVLIDYDDAYYYLSGKIDKEVFVKLAEKLYFD